MAHEASDFLDGISVPQHITSCTEMNNVMMKKLNQIGALTVTDTKEHFCSPWPAQDSNTALWSSSAIQEREGPAEGSTENQENGQSWRGKDTRERAEEWVQDMI